MRTRLICCAIGFGSLFAGFEFPVHAEGYPERPVKIVVPFPAGGASDAAARLVAQALQSGLGQAVVIENQSGAGGSIAMKQAANAAPDGYTLMTATSGAFGSLPLLYKLDFDPIKAFTPVATVMADKGVLVVNPSLPVKSIHDLVLYAKTNPGKLNYGSAIGITQHFVAELFKIKNGLDIQHVPYRGAPPVITDLLAGQIQMTFNNKSLLLPHIQADKLRPLAVISAERWPELPDVPTLIEAGYMDAAYDVLFGVVTPAGAPTAVIDKLNAAINEGLRSPQMRTTFAKLGIDPKITTPQEFAAIIAEDTRKWAAAARMTGIKVE
jgi:tripartite-type tricarboxylate transporter receptor subunit TctC